MRRICENKTYDSSRVLSWSITGTERFRILVSGILTIHFWFLFLLIFNYWHGTTKLALTEGPQASFKDLTQVLYHSHFLEKSFLSKSLWNRKILSQSLSKNQFTLRPSPSTQRNWRESYVTDLVQKRMTKWNFPKIHIFVKNVSSFKTRYKKTPRFTQLSYKYAWDSVRKCFWKMCNIKANIEYFNFRYCCNFTFSQIEMNSPNILWKKTRTFVRWLYVKHFFTVNVKYCGFFLV